MNKIASCAAVLMLFLFNICSARAPIQVNLPFDIWGEKIGLVRVDFTEVNRLTGEENPQSMWMSVGTGATYQPVINMNPSPIGYATRIKRVTILSERRTTALASYIFGQDKGCDDLALPSDNTLSVFSIDMKQDPNSSHKLICIPQSV